MTRNKNRTDNKLSRKINNKASDKKGNYLQVTATPPTPQHQYLILQSYKTLILLLAFFILSCSDSTSLSGADAALATYLKASNTSAGDRFGYSVALSANGNTLAIGATWESGDGRGVNPADNNNAVEVGAVYVYTRSGNTWGNPVYIKASNADAQDEFGWSVALSSDGNTLAVGAPFEGGSGTGVNPAKNNAFQNDFTGAGAVYIYTKDASSTWSETAYLKASNTSADDEFGTIITLSDDGNTLAVGVPIEDSSSSGVNQADNNDARDAGAVYIYTKDASSTWVNPVYLKASNTSADDEFGTSVALSSDGNTLAVGAIGEDGSGRGVNQTANNDDAANTGAVYVYTRTGDTWGNNPVYIKANNSDSDDAFGSSVALSSDGNTLAVAAGLEANSGRGVNPEDNNDAQNAGAVYVYTRTSGTWGNEPVYIKASNTDADDNFGWSLTLSSDGNKLAVGARREDGSESGINPTDNNDAENAGAVYVYTRTGGVWGDDIVYVKASNTGVDDRFGWSVALSGNGSTLAVGTRREDGSGTGANPADNNDAENAGAVYIYTGF